MPMKQCAGCPWLKSAKPREDIPRYDESRHHDLKETIACPGSITDLKTLRMMACHETPDGAESPCVGWMHHQLNEGNNIALRLAAVQGRVQTDYELRGPQHESFQDTLPT